MGGFLKISVNLFGPQDLFLLGGQITSPIFYLLYGNCGQVLGLGTPREGPSHRQQGFPGYGQCPFMTNGLLIVLCIALQPKIKI